MSDDSDLHDSLDLARERIEFAVLPARIEWA
jgi:urocanate hydratase